MGKGELKIIVGSEKEKDFTPGNENPLDGSQTVLIKTDPKNGKLKPPKKIKNGNTAFLFFTPLYTNKICFRATISVLMTIALICVIFLAVCLMQYAKEHNLQEVFRGGRSNWPFSNYKANKRVNPAEKDEKDKPKENGPHKTNALKEKHHSVGKEKSVKFELGHTADHCSHWRHDETCGNYSVLHATRRRWAAIADHKTKTCYLFKLRNEGDVCPKSYPWIVDKHMGILPRVLPASADQSLQEFTAVYQRVSRCVLRVPMADLSLSGPMMSTWCGHYTSYRVMGVAVVYRSRQRRSADTFLDVFKNHAKVANSGDEEGYQWSSLTELPAHDDKESKWFTTTMDENGVEIETTAGTKHPNKAGAV